MEIIVKLIKNSILSTSHKIMKFPYPLNRRMSAQGTYRFYSLQRQTILLVNGEPLGRERDKLY